MSREGPSPDPACRRPDLHFLPPGRPRGTSFCPFHTPLRPLASDPGAGGAEPGAWPPRREKWEISIQAGGWGWDRDPQKQGGVQGTREQTWLRPTQDTTLAPEDSPVSPTDAQDPATVAHVHGGSRPAITGGVSCQVKPQRGVAHACQNGRRQQIHQHGGREGSLVLRWGTHPQPWICRASRISLLCHLPFCVFFNPHTRIFSIGF